jgi:hypothetical protein
MQGFESTFREQDSDNLLSYEAFEGLLRLSTSNKVCYFDHTLGYLRKTLEILSQERAPNLYALNSIWSTLDSLDSASWNHSREDIVLG